MRKVFLAAAAALAIGTSSGTALGDMFADWDENRDLYVGEQEWDEALIEDGLFEEWDLDGDGTLSPAEFNSQLFRGYDVDRDRRLSLREFESFARDRDEGIFRD